MGCAAREPGLYLTTHCVPRAWGRTWHKGDTQESRSCLPGFLDPHAMLYSLLEILAVPPRGVILLWLSAC